MKREYVERYKRNLKVLLSTDISTYIGVYPYGELGHYVVSWLEEECSARPPVIVDNYSTEEGVKKLAEIEDAGQYIWILSTYSPRLYDLLKKDLLKIGADENRIVDICDIEKDRKQIVSGYKKRQEHYNKVIQDIRKRGGKIRFASYVTLASQFGGKKLVELMLRNPDRWDIKFVIIPVTSRGEDFKKKEYIATRKHFIDEYGKQMVVDGYNPDTGEVYDPSDMFDMVYHVLPYDSSCEWVHSIEYMTTRNVLPIYITYGYEVAMDYMISRLLGKELNSVWKCFTDTVYTMDDYREYQLLQGRNVELTGYAKMDELKINPNIKKSRKKIFLIAPHHTVSDPMLPLSNFLNYAEFFKKLPEMYPEAHFVFRPHPSLFTAVVNEGIWSNQQVEEYLKEIEAAGISYSTEADYLHLYNECDAIINDCGSFTIEWLFTGKPGCFMMNPLLSKEHLTTLMHRALKHYTIAREEKDISSFIEMVLDDRYEIKREAWVEKNIMVNYPNVSDKILEKLDVLR